MTLKHWLLVGMVIAVAMGCARQGSDLAHYPITQKEGKLTAREAGDVAYRYAFSGQVLHSETGEAIQKFSVEVAGGDGAISSVLNALGDPNGVFHISRNPLSKDNAFSTVPVIISAPGFESLVQIVDLGADCQVARCAGAKPTHFSLKPLKAMVESLAPSVPLTTEGVLPEKIGEKIATRGIANLFKEMGQIGKVDGGTEALLAQSKNATVLKNMLVMLGGNPSEQQTQQLVTTLLSGIKGDKLKNLQTAFSSSMNAMLPLIVATQPELGAALIAVNALLPYLGPVLGKMNSQEKLKIGNLGQVLNAMAKDPNLQTNLIGIFTKLQNGNQGKQAQLAMTTLLPLLENLVGSVKAGDKAPFASLLKGALQSPNLMALLTQNFKSNTKNAQSLQLLLTYLQPLLQGLAGQEAPELAALFNELMKSTDLLGLKNFPQNGSQAEKFAKLLPYLQPLIRGLNSKDARTLANLLDPLISKGNAAANLAAFLTSVQPNNPNVAAVASTLFPTLQTLLSQYVPNKQLFTAQLLEGMLNGTFKNIQVVQDLKGAPGLVVSGTARDLFKLAQLQNVEKLISIDEINQ